MVVIPDRASQRNNFQIIPLSRPRITLTHLLLLPTITAAVRDHRHPSVPRARRAVGVDMTLRRRLPQRRGTIAVELEHAGHHFRMQIGCFPDGALGDVFLDAAKQNSGLDAFAADVAILVSLLLQHGATPAEIGHALRRAPDGTAASLVGAVVDWPTAMEEAATMNFAQRIDFDSLMELVALRLLGEPAQKRGSEWRYGNRGSLVIDLKKGAGSTTRPMRAAESST